MSAIENTPPESRRELTLLTKNPTRIVEFGPRAVQDDLDRYQTQLVADLARVDQLKNTTMLSEGSKVVAYRWLIDQIQKTMADIEMQKQLHEYTYFNLSFTESKRFDSLRQSFAELLAAVQEQLQTVAAQSTASAESR